MMDVLNPIVTFLASMPWLVGGVILFGFVIGVFNPTGQAITRSVTVVGGLSFLAAVIAGIAAGIGWAVAEGMSGRDVGFGAGFGWAFLKVAGGGLVLTLLASFGTLVGTATRAMLGSLPNDDKKDGVT